MAREADYDTDLFAEMVRSGRPAGKKITHSLSDAEPSDDKKRKTATQRRS